MPSLTQAEAQGRGALLRVRSYRVDLDLTLGDEIFRSTTRIVFDARSEADGTFLDVRPRALRSASLNGRELDVAALEDGRLTLTGLADENEIVVVADMAYSRECEGLHRYTDPADGRVYLYAFVFIDNAPRIFACFDQPDLKAPFTFTVTVPDDDWQVLGNAPATRLGAGRWRLAETAPLATYLTTLAVGPYESFHAEHDGVPLGLHCRASLADGLKDDIDEVFEITGQCLDEYGRMFGVPYPFGKFDQVFVPEFSVLSLDHPGCVLLRELYLFGSAVPASERETRAVVIAHGLSLMWLAGLVTNTWWDDLWLGQAFADYMAHRVTSDVTRFSGPLTTFAVRRKAQAYVADQRPSTHPVSLAGPDVRTVLLELDRISYFKGSSVLRQLAARVGTPALREGLRVYFTRHAYGTATFSDFLAALSEATGTDLTEWARVWFSTCDVSTVTPELTVTDGVITAAAVRQDVPSGHPVTRPHTLDVGCYGDESTTVRVAIEGPRTELPQLVGRPAPKFVLLNDGDLTYAKIRFDDRSRAALPEFLPRLSPVNRAMVWCALLLAVQDGAYPAADHLDLVTGMLAVEPEPSIVVEVLEQARLDVADRFLHPARRSVALAAIAGAIRDRMAEVAPSDEIWLCLCRGLVEFSADVVELRGWLDGTRLPAGLVLDADLAWRTRYRLAVLGGLSEDEIDAAHRADPSTRGEQFAAKCRAARPDPAAKSAAWEAILGDTGVSSYGLWALAEGFWQPEQADLTAEYVPRFFAEMPAAARLRGDLVLDVLVRFLYPRYAASPETLRLADELLARADVELPLRRRVADFTDDLRRAVAARSDGTD
ncbi:aminopeptidase N [Amycolatopsis sp. WAC 01416]|uniref:aminopeptidase N n=1 Tax=Amycolatopsis sp. WAC 01416 TaxID=2203196 RepID=UPI000F76CEAD|nr:aminopeptidase N [Amycolatopsis sp. WAC 01416]RSN24748.1 aminopeptidase N [Amycolatopsis sp. WAC 01416]